MMAWSIESNDLNEKDEETSKYADFDHEPAKVKVTQVLLNEYGCNILVLNNHWPIFDEVSYQELRRPEGSCLQSGPRNRCSFC